MNLRISILVIAIITLSIKPLEAQTYGVAIVPRMGMGDNSEQLIYKYIGSRDDIDHIFVPENEEKFFELLNKFKKSGKLINTLIIAGHGARKNPNITFKDGALLPSDISLEYQCRKLNEYKEIVKKRIANGNDETLAAAQVKIYEKRINSLVSLPNIMAKNGEVMLLNCSTFATEIGKTFVQNLGMTLLSLRGGTIRASKTDIGIGQVEDVLDLLYGIATRNERQDVGDFWVKGDWEVIPIAAYGLKNEPFCDMLPKKDSNKLILLEHSFEVINPEGKNFISGNSGSTPTSKWNIDESHFEFKSEKDGFNLNIYWDKMPEELYAFESYPFYINVDATGGPRKVAVVFTPVMDITGWKIELDEGSPGSKNLGTNATGVFLEVSSDKEKNFRNDGFMQIIITPVGRRASIENGKVVGGNGKFFSGKQPGEFDAYFLELQCNGIAKIRWTFVPENSPHLK